MVKKILFCLLILPSFLFSQHKITAHFEPKEIAPFALLYRLTPTQPMHVSGASKWDENESFQIPLTANSKAGMYKLVYANPTNKKIIYLIFDGKSDVSFSFSTKKGALFSDNQNKWLHQFLTNRSIYLKRMKEELSKNKPNLDTIKLLIHQQQKMQMQSKEDAGNSFVSHYINALSIPFSSSIIDLSSFITYRKVHFWDNFIVSDSLLQASNYPIQLAKRYYSIAAKGSHNQTLIDAAIDTIMKNMQKGTTYFQKQFLINFWQYLQPLGEDEALTYIAKRYFLPLAKQQHQTKLTSDLQRYIRLSIGEKLPNMGLQSKWTPHVPKTLYDLTGAHYYIIVFWSSKCPHCKEEVPEINKKLDSFPPALFKVISIGLERDATTWLQEQKKLTHFMNIITLGEERIATSEKYDIQRIPTYFVLDRNKMIIAKPKSLTTLLATMERLALPKN